MYFCFHRNVHTEAGRQPANTQNSRSNSGIDSARLFFSILLSMRRPQLEGEVVRGSSDVLAVRRHVRVDDATRVALERPNGGPLGVAPQLGRLVEGTRQDVVVAFGWRWVGERKNNSVTTCAIKFRL